MSDKVWMAVFRCDYDKVYDVLGICKSRDTAVQLIENQVRQDVSNNLYYIEPKDTESVRYQQAFLEEWEPILMAWSEEPDVAHSQDVANYQAQLATRIREELAGNVLNSDSYSYFKITEYTLQ